MKSTAVQLEILNTAFKEAIGSKLLPELNKLIPILSELIPTFELVITMIKKFATFFAENPFKSVIAALAESIAFEVTKAKIGSVITEALKRITAIGLPVAGAGPVPVAPSGGAGNGFTTKTGFTGAGAVSAAGTGLSLGFAVGTMIVTAQVVNFEKGEQDMTEGGKLVSRARELATTRLQRDLTPEEIAEGRDIQMKLGKMQTASKTPGIGESALATVIDGASWAGPVGWAAKAAGLDGKEVAQKIVNSDAPVVQKTLADMVAIVDALRPVIEAQTKAAAEQKAAAAALENAAAAVGGIKPNMGDKPTGVK
jgi:hypothetical protein